MSYYPDLSRYTHHLSLRRRKTLNVGWLDGGHQFEVARPAKWIVERLWSYCQFSLAESHGYHDCNLADCPGPAKKLSRFSPAEKTRILRALEQRRTFCSNFVKAGGANTATARLMSMVDQEWQSAMRGYSRIIIGIHPDSGERIELGYAELRVSGEHGKIYAAPNILYHYVTVHHYKPPEEFVQALKHATCPPDPGYLRR